MGHEGVTVAADGHEPTSLEGTTMRSTFVTTLSITASPPTDSRA
jgi:hypothetical protein